MKKNLPPLNSDADAEAFLEGDLTDYLTQQNFQPARFEFLPKNAKVNLRLSQELLTAIKGQASEQHIPYQRYIRQLLEQAVH